jgi:drug/metabolite transporter (DMT)-like permease
MVETGFRYIGVFVSVCITLFTAVLLGYAAKSIPTGSWMFWLVISFVIFLNAAKFVVWGYLNKKYDLSKTYPLTSVFFPAIFFISILLDETVVTPNKIAGLLIILFGIVYFEKYGVER